jgi:hypothetical protein
MYNSIFFINVSFIFLSRKSIIFWKQANNFENMLEKIEDKTTISKLYETEFKKLIKLSFARQHSEELNRLYSIMQIKSKYLK